jgi:hypothetical protein
MKEGAGLKLLGSKTVGSGMPEGAGERLPFDRDVCGLSTLFQLS